MPKKKLRMIMFFILFCCAFHHGYSLYEIFDTDSDSKMLHAFWLGVFLTSIGYYLMIEYWIDRVKDQDKVIKGLVTFNKLILEDMKNIVGRITKEDQ